MITKLKRLDLGCHVHNTFIGCIMYADDLLLISASDIDLQRILDVCSDVGFSLGINFNAQKSSCIAIGPTKCLILDPLLINKCCIQWSDKICYLIV